MSCEKVFPHSCSIQVPNRTSNHGARSLLNLEFSKISDNSNFQCGKNHSAKILAGILGVFGDNVCYLLSKVSNSLQTPTFTNLLLISLNMKTAIFKLQDTMFLGMFNQKIHWIFIESV